MAAPLQRPIHLVKSKEDILLIVKNKLNILIQQLQNERPVLAFQAAIELQCFLDEEWKYREAL